MTRRGGNTVVVLAVPLIYNVDPFKSVVMVLKQLAGVSYARFPVYHIIGTILVRYSSYTSYAFYAPLLSSVRSFPIQLSSKTSLEVEPFVGTAFEC